MNLPAITCTLLFLGQAGPSFPDMAKKAVALSERRERAEAIKILDEMKAKAEGQLELQLYVQWKRGYCLYILGDFTQAQTVLKEGIDNAPKKLRFLHLMYRELGEAYLDAGKVELAEPCLQAVLDALAGKGPIENPLPLEVVEVVRIRLVLARCRMFMGRFEQAGQELAKLSAAIAEVARAGPFTEDWACRFAQCEMLQTTLDRREHNMVRSLRRAEDSLKALKGFNSSLALQLQFSTLISQANCGWLLARFDEAQDQLNAAEKFVLFIPAERNWGDLKSARAGLLLEKSSLAVETDPAAPGIFDDLDRAEKALLEAIGHYAKADAKEDIYTGAANFQLGQVHDLRGRVLAFRGENKQAAAEFALGKRRCDKAVEALSPPLPADNDYVLEARHKRAWLSLRLGDVPAAHKEAGEARDLYVKAHGKDDVDVGRFHHLLLEIEERAGNFAQAARHAEAHRRLVAKGLTTFRAGLTAPEKIQFFRKWDDPGLHAALRLAIRHSDAETGLAEQSAEWLINGKAKVAEVMAEVYTRIRGGGDYQKFQQSVRRQAFLLYGGEPAADVKDLQKELLWEESKKRDLAANWPIRAAEGWHPLIDIRKRLDGQDVFVGIFCLRPEETSPRTYFAWVVAAEGPVKIVRLGEANPIEKLVANMVHHQENFAELRKAGEKKTEQDLRRDCLVPLSRFLLEPILKLTTGKKRWIVSPDGPLWNVPWGALVIPAGDKYAIEEITFRYAISGRDLLEQPGPEMALGEPLILGDPDLEYLPKDAPGRMRKSGDFLYLADSLRASETECRLVAGILKDSLKLQPRLVLGMMTKDDLLAAIKPPRIVYLSTHSFSRLQLPNKLHADDPLLACAIAFAGWNFVPQAGTKVASLPGLMTGAEVLGVNLHGTELVVLASCQSGAGVSQYGQSPADLRHAFHLAGARGVVSSLWSINDKSTTDLMVPFMQTLCSKTGAGDKAAALRTAQLQMMQALREHRAHAHPFYWAAFTLSGS